MLERLQNMKMNARGNGKTTCLLCNEQFGLFRLQTHKCELCNKVTFQGLYLLTFFNQKNPKFICSKCGVDTYTSKKDIVWHCKICSESREVSWWQNIFIQRHSFCLYCVDFEKIWLLVSQQTHLTGIYVQFYEIGKIKLQKLSGKIF